MSNERLAEAVRLLRRQVELGVSASVSGDSGRWQAFIDDARAFLRALDAAPAEEPSDEFARGMEAVTAIRCLEHYTIPIQNTTANGTSECAICIRDAASAGAAALVGFLESLDDLFVALRDAEPSGKGVPITLKALVNGLHEQTRIFLARKAPVQG